jgi:Homing endonuclease associated repeat
MENEQTIATESAPQSAHGKPGSSTISLRQAGVCDTQPAFSPETASVVRETVDEPTGSTIRGAVGGRGIIAAIRKMAERLGRYPSMPELRAAYPAIKMGTVRRYFGGYGEALREAGFEGGGCGYTVTMDALFRDWARLARKFQRCPTMSEYERESKYSVRPLVGRFRTWSQVPRGLYGYAEKKELNVEFGDVMEMVRGHYGEDSLPQRAQRNTEKEKNGPQMNADQRGSEGQESEGTTIDPRRWQAREARPRKVPVLPDRPIYGRPMVTAGLGCAPTNESGVIYVFGMLAERLGFVVMKIQTEFPDCEALRYLDEGRWQHVRIEFEFESRNFLKHMHDTAGCDLIVCWEHNWGECPVEVIELRRVIGS